MATARPVRRFAPLTKSKQGHDAIDGEVLRGIVFDVDGTLCE